jgi:hypothetical protein
MIPPNQSFQIRSEEIAAKVIDGEAIIIDLATGTYFSTDHVGAFVWQRAEAGYDLEALSRMVEESFEVEPETDVAGDIGAFVEQLVAESLLAERREPVVPTAASDVPTPSRAYSRPVLHAYRDMNDMLALDPPVPGLEPIPWSESETSDPGSAE